ncbi:hypothetical protein CLI64_10245 [Nostoc sp. CENA543]|uniref:hypothetical protein n=1 Tax=Nostoc sp. CENA543 TaxID=1869241 RepID=UPI000CA2FFB0|nr:hypothetical protein [Nostoc sp. CENA543]AUT00748.1 hypothetical protein CLI64_10245 [Nostoc sp. CENA543]
MNNQLNLEPPPQDFISPLLELRDYYSRLVEEYETLYTQARSQLDHVQALLANWSVATETKSQVATLEVSQDVSKNLQDEPLLSSSDQVSQVVIDSVEPSADSEENEEAVTVAETKVASTPEVTAESIKGIDFPMLPEYKAMSRMEAIQKLLQEHLGAVCHIDFIVRSLYGELDPHIFKVVKGRVQSSLTQGRERKVWFGIPDEPGCYTIDLTLVNSNRTHTYSRNGKSKRKPPLIVPKAKVVPMLKPYEGQFLIDALTVFFRHNPGKVFSVAEVVTGLYGDINDEDYREVKGKVLNELSRGYRIGRFDRMPEKVGFYTLDVDLAN